MLHLFATLFVPFLLIGGAIPVSGQVRSQVEPSVKAVSSGNPPVAAMVSKKQVRMTALTLAQRIRLEVLSQTGEPVYDSDFRPGNRLEWPVKDQQGSELRDGIYGCIVTVEDLDGQITNRRGIFRVKDGAVSFDVANWGPAAAASDEQESLTLLRTEESSPFILASHDEKEGWIESASGGLTFHAGSLTDNRDAVPHLRLTPEGNVGIGVAEPQAKLDVAGLIRASQGFQFADGTILKMEGGQPVLVSEKANGIGVTSPVRGDRMNRVLAAGGNVGVVLADRGFPRRVLGLEGEAPYYNTLYGLDAGGALTTGSYNSFFGLNAGISNTTESNNSFIGAYSGGLAGITNATAIGYRSKVTQSNSLVLGGINGINGATADTNVGMGTTSPNYRLHIYHTGTYPRIYIQGDSGRYPGFQLGFDTIGSRVALMRAVEQDTNGTALQFYTRTDAAEMIQGMVINDVGNVGIGTTTPTSRLTVAGNVNVTGNGNGIIFSDGSALTSSLAARIRSITYLAGCDNCGVLTDDDDQRTIFVNFTGAMTINSVTCFSDAGSPVINLQRDSGTQANILTSNLTCATTGATSTSIVGAQSVLNLNDKLDFVMVSAGGVAKRVTVAIKATVD